MSRDGVTAWEFVVSSTKRQNARKGPELSPGDSHLAVRRGDKRERQGTDREVGGKPGDCQRSQEKEKCGKEEMVQGHVR